MVRRRDAVPGTAAPAPVHATPTPARSVQVTAANGLTRSCATTTSDTTAEEFRQTRRCSSVPFCTTYAARTRTGAVLDPLGTPSQSSHARRTTASGVPAGPHGYAPPAAG